MVHESNPPKPDPKKLVPPKPCRSSKNSGGGPESAPLNGPLPTKPSIRLSPGDMHLASHEAEQVLAATGCYFTSAGMLVRIVNRGNLGIATEHVNEQTLKAVLSATINWERKGRDGVWVRCDPPHDVVKALLFGQDRHHLKPLNGLARQPYYAPGGQLIARPGYEPGTAIYGAFDASDYPPDDPTRELAEHSLAHLNHYLDEFEFESAIDRSAALSAMLTAVVRPSLPVAPAFNITATSSGSGKSYLADLITGFAGPGDPYRVSYPSGAEEAGKLIVTALMERPEVIAFDDMQTNWKPFGPINRMLTSPTTTERLLGTNRSATVATRALFIGTGNNTEPERDLRRRVVSIRIAPRSETPALRSFRRDPVAELRKRRPKAVRCALNIIGAFRASGETMKHLPAIGSYEEWSLQCRHPLVWLGLPDPAQSLINQVSHDPERQFLAEFLDAWHRHLGSKSVTVRALIAKAEQQSDLMEALEELPVMDGRYVNRGKLGYFMRRNLGRRAEGLRIEQGDSSERRSWRVVAD